MTKRFAFRLRTLLFLVTLFAIAMSWFASRLKEGRLQERYFIALSGWQYSEAYGGDFEGEPIAPFIPNMLLDESCLLLPEWIVQHLPEELHAGFYRVTELDIYIDMAWTEDFEKCLVFKDVRTIRIGPVREPEKLFTVFQGFPNLETIHIDPIMSEVEYDADLVHKYLPNVNVIQAR
ncbi:hypothetical protein OAS39_09100 [Pirellulales bacterium]|nr:hypothetical protein [Pirellulales bacterium]